MTCNEPQAHPDRCGCARTEAPTGPLCFCGLTQTKNPHPDAGKPERILEVGAVYECIPCLNKSRHEWSQRALKAEREAAEFRARPHSQQSAADAVATVSVWHVDQWYAGDSSNAGRNIGVKFLGNYAETLTDGTPLYLGRAAPERDNQDGDGEAVEHAQVTSHLDEIDAPAWEFINEEAQKVGAATGRVETYNYERANGVVIVLWDADRIHAMAVTVRDGFNRTRCVRMLAANEKAVDLNELAYLQAIKCPHTIDDHTVVLRFDPSQPGHNALNQLARRLAAPTSTARKKP